MDAIPGIFIQDLDIISMNALELELKAPVLITYCSEGSVCKIRVFISDKGPVCSINFPIRFACQVSLSIITINIK